MIRASFVVLSCAATAAAIASTISDLRLIAMARGAPRSGLTIGVVRHDDWWQLRYSRGGVSFVTANELHVPAGEAVALTWTGAPQPWIDHAMWLDNALVADGSASSARFISLHPLMWRQLHIIAEPRDAFERWFDNEASAAHNHDGAMLFENAGCAYCHVIRGVAQEATQTAPDLTHFASRHTIAATAIPVTQAYLTGWVAHSRGLKKSSRMPDNAIDPRALHPLIRYLETLQ